jgi:3,4-dihydroxy 2-butanone 4-phosphate synthase/GTP cyclohydrolase II
LERLGRETIVEEAAVAHLPSIHAAGPFDVHAYRGLLDGCEHLAMVHAPQGAGESAPFTDVLPLVRVHSECLTGDALGSLRCDCGDQLRRSLALIAADPVGGAVIYLRGHEGRGIGLVNKIRAYALQDRGLDTVEANEELGFPADLRDYAVAVQILGLLGAKRVRLLSNNPRKGVALERYGIAVAERLPLRIGPNPHNARYLETKRRKLGHDLLAAR